MPLRVATWKPYRVPEYLSSWGLLCYLREQFTCNPVID